MVAYGTYQSASLPRGGEYRVHHILFPNQLLSPQEAVCCIIKRDAFNHSTVLKHSFTFKKKKLCWRGQHNSPPHPHCVHSSSPDFSALSEQFCSLMVSVNACYFLNFTFILKGVLLHLLGMAIKHSSAF